jgi:hypothetical protein
MVKVGTDLTTMGHQREIFPTSLTAEGYPKLQSPSPCSTTILLDARGKFQPTLVPWKWVSDYKCYMGPPPTVLLTRYFKRQY